MKEIIAISAFECRMWSLHDRLDSQVNENTCRAEIESFLKHGQLVPALGRPLRNDTKHKVELIFGARRLFVARHLNRPLTVELRELSDREAICVMDIENRHRKDLSPYERGLSYSKWLREGHFRSQEDIARALRLSASQVSRMLKIAQLPATITDCFKSPLELCESWALNLVEAAADPRRTAGTMKEAREIAACDPRPPVSEVYRRLLAASANGRKVARKPHDEVIKNSEGTPLFRIRQMHQSISVVIATERVSHKQLMRIRQVVAEILESGREDNLPERRVSPLNARLQSHCE
jgi:ParB/RepB/Spo0J family partition protein